jgi:Fe-S cluster biosynthesis and repair protein YggX
LAYPGPVQEYPGRLEARSLKSKIDHLFWQAIMSRIVNCIKLKREAEGLDFPPYPGEIGTRIWQSISKEAWKEWKQVQTRLINENRLNLADPRARKYLVQQMERFLFEDGNIEADGFVPPSA